MIADQRFRQGVKSGEDDSGRMADALLKCATFPVDQQPRPLVLTGNPVQVKGFKNQRRQACFPDGKRPLRRGASCG